tara:strand:+ start:22165 stop:23166 length:1002 start_codon:yes stop_codon:yes gene_type:complete
MPKGDKKLSASRVKTLDSCSWSYWCNYHLKVPQRPNSGAIRGTICHLVFELLLDHRHHHHYKKILKNNSIKGSPAVDRLIIKHLTRQGIIDDGESYEMCDKMILVGLQYDFFGDEETEVVGIEKEFLLNKIEPKYKAIGFMDKVLKKKNSIKIVDYKSSKYKFRGDEIDSNIQAMLYTIAAKDEWPECEEDILVEFLFLRFPRSASQQIRVSKEQLAGFEHYLEHVYKVINEFDEETAKSNYAAHNQHVQWMCKAGKTWRCPYLDPVEYYVLLDSNGEVTKSSFAEENLKVKKGYSIEKRRYAGCPAHVPQASSEKDEFDLDADDEEIDEFDF